jgi:hypothetical protein
MDPKEPVVAYEILTGSKGVLGASRQGVVAYYDDPLAGFAKKGLEGKAVRSILMRTVSRSLYCAKAVIWLNSSSLVRFEES